VHTANTLSHLPELTGQQAEAWIAAALAAERALRQYDDHLFPSPKDAAAMQVATQLRDAWRQWVDDAESLLRRVEPLLRAKRHVAGAADLEYCVARGRYIVETPPELIQQRRDQAERGEAVTTTEELRRELRAANPR
jgi:hypothetical protein